jgi:hypothetical protein
MERTGFFRKMDNTSLRQPNKRPSALYFGIFSFFAVIVSAAGFFFGGFQYSFLILLSVMAIEFCPLDPTSFHRNGLTLFYEK